MKCLSQQGKRESRNSPKTLFTETRKNFTWPERKGKAAHWEKKRFNQTEKRTITLLMPLGMLRGIYHICRNNMNIIFFYCPIQLDYFTSLISYFRFITNEY